MTSKQNEIVPIALPNIYQRILAIMSELDYIQKGDKTVNGQYRFVSHDQVTARIHPLLVKHGLAIIPNVEEITQENNRTMVKLLLHFVNADCPNESFCVRYCGYGVDSGDKGPGKAISYAYKYALLKTFCLETGDDPDNEAESRYEPAKCQEFDILLPSISEKEGKRIAEFIKEKSKEYNKHPEDIKREACKRMPEFLEAVKKWKPEKKDEE